MKRIVLSAVAAAMLAATALPGQAAPLNAPSPQSNYTHVDWKKDEWKRKHDRREMKRKPGHREYRRDQWRHGQRYSDWKRHRPVNDWRKYGLRRPGPGQEWIRVGNDYLLVGIMSGVIAGIIAAH